MEKYSDKISMIIFFVDLFFKILENSDKLTINIIITYSIVTISVLFLFFIFICIIKITLTGNKSDSNKK